MSEKPEHQRPELPEFWNKRFAEGVTPWAATGVPQELVGYAEAFAGRPRILVPGCGHAREAGWLATLGWAVTAIDFSPQAIAAAHAELGDWPGTLQQADFFAFAPAAPFDLVYERAFLCALPRKRWADYGRRMRELVAPGGCLIGYFFFGDDPRGPPFGIAAEELTALLAPHFVCVYERPAAASIPVFAGRERWQVWQRSG